MRRVCQFHHSRLMAIMPFSRLGVSAAVIASAMTSAGMARKTSVTRMITVSTQPP